MRLYQSAETKFDTNGIGALSPVSCFVTEERNGEYELEMEYPIDGEHYADIKNRCIILAKPNPTDQEQPFRVYKITRPFDGIVTVYARHISYDLSGIPVGRLSAGNVSEALSKIKTNSAVTNPFVFWTDKSTVASFSVSEPSSIRSIMGGKQGSLLDAYGGEYAYDRYTVRLYNQRGMDRGVTIRYGKNLTDLTQEENIESVYTGVYPFWAKENEYLELPEKTVAAEGTYDFIRIRPLDLSAEWENKPTVAQLRSRAQSFMAANNIGVPKVSIKVSFIPLEQTEEYKDIALLERVSLCDGVTVRFDRLGVNATAKCVKTVYNVLTGRYDSVELGEAKTNITDTIAEQQKIANETITTSDMQNAIAAATAWLTNGKGYMVARRDAAGNVIDTLYMDTPDINTAVNILRVGQSGIGFSHNGVNGPYVSAWTIDGHFNADFIDAGTINGSQVRVVNLSATNIIAGILQSAGGESYWNLDTGQFSVSGNVMSKSSTPGDSRMAFLGGGQIALLSDNTIKGTIYTLDDGISMRAASAIEMGVGPEKNYVINYNVNPNGYTERHIFTGHMRLANNSRIYNTNGVSMGSGTTDSGTRQVAYFGGGGIYTEGNLSCGGTKNRAVKTAYGTIGMNAFETPGAHFADFGSGVIGADGLCYVWLDPVFLQTIDPHQQYQVFVSGGLRAEKAADYFVVRGDPGTAFDWQIVAKQRGYQDDRAERIDIAGDGQIDFDDSIFSDASDVEAGAEEYLTNYYKEIFDYD